MADETTADDVRAPGTDIQIRRITPKDLWHALREGLEDFNARPSFGAFLILIYPLFALLVTLFALDRSLIYLAYPVVAGFTLLGPMVSVVLFSMSRRREQGQTLRWREAFDFIHSPRFAPILGLSVLMMLLYVGWLVLAQFLYVGLFGAHAPESFAAFTEWLFTTRSGAGLMLYGNAVGALFAFAALAMSAVAFPLLLDKPVSLLTAVGTSIRAVTSNLEVMLLWGLIVVTLLAGGAIVFLVGLAAVLPILGHATWHLYRRLVEA